jgi:F-type H+-transporting ATPase subunit b
MQFDWWTLALQTVNFAILVWLLQRFLYKPVLRLIDARRAEVDAGYAAAAAAKQATESERQAVAAERVGIADERDTVLRKAVAQAEQAAIARRKQAESEAAGLIAETRRSLAEEHGAARAELRRQALELGLTVARRLLDEIPPALRAEAWLERIEQHVAALAPEERAALRDGVHGGLTVVTASALPEAARADWQRRLRAALDGTAGHALAIDFAVDPALIAGADLHFANAILRFSWQDRLDGIRAGLESDVHAG